MDDFFAIFFTVILVLCAGIGITSLLSDVIHPTNFIKTCETQGYYQYQQQRIICALEPQ